MDILEKQKQNQIIYNGVDINALKEKDEDFLIEGQEDYLQKVSEMGNLEGEKTSEKKQEEDDDSEIPQEAEVISHELGRIRSASEVRKANFAGYEKRRDEKYASPNLMQMKQDHTAVYRDETKVIKHTFKADQVVTERKLVIDDKERQLREKAIMAKFISKNARQVTDAKVKARNEMSIDKKKKMDYRTFSQLSEFSAYMSKEDFADLTTVYGDGVAMDRIYDKDNPKSVKERQKKREDNLYPAMDVMTDVVMKIDLRGLDVSTDRAISSHARELEKMSGVVKAYRELLQQNADYMEKKFAEKTESGATFGSIIMEKLEKLSAISNYYRLRKLVLEDDLYGSLANEEISMETEDGDNVKMKNLKRNMRLSYQAGVQLKKVMNDTDIIPEAFQTKDMIGGASATRLSSERMKEVFKQEVFSDLSEYEKQAMYLAELVDRDKLVTRTEHEQLFIAPNEMYNKLTLDPKKQRKTPASGKYTAAMFQNVHAGANPFVFVESAGKKKLADRYLKMGKNKTGDGWGECPKFKGGKDDYLADIEISDSWNRTAAAYTTEYSYRRTDDEVMEMIDLLSIQKDAKEWEKIKGDPEKLAYYESAYKEMAMRDFEAIYGCAMRVAFSIGMKSLLLHPIDLMQQIDMDVKRLSYMNSVLTNITGDKNVERIKKLFDDNNSDGRYLFDMDSLNTVGGVMASFNFKLTALTSVTSSIYEPAKEDNAPPDPAQFFGYDVRKAVKKEFAAYINKLRKDGSPELSKYENYKDDNKTEWYINRHPELFSVKNLLRKNSDGNPMFQKVMIHGVGTFYNEGEMNIRKLMESGLFEKPTEEEINAYEQSLKDRNFFAIREPSESYDKEDIQSDIKKFQGFKDDAQKKLAELQGQKGGTPEEIKKRNEKIKENENKIVNYNGRVAELKKILEYANGADEKLEEDPYALRMVTSGFKELEYDNNGETKIVQTSKILVGNNDEV